MKLIFHPGAQTEYAEAAQYYESRVRGLGGDFTLEIEAALQQISEDPQHWRRVDEDVRRCLVRRFPYGLLYTIEASHILTAPTPPSAPGTSASGPPPGGRSR